MKTFKIRHNFCGMETYITGYDKWDAFRKNNKDEKIWTIIEEKA